MVIQLICPSCQREISVESEITACPACGAAIALPSAHPSHLGSFSVSHLSGQSTLWNTYLGRDTDRQEVLLKVLAPSFPLNQGHIAAFYAAIAQRTALRSPHIQRILDCGESDGYHYAVLRHQPGDSLDERVSIFGKLPQTFAVEIARDIAEALAIAWGSHAIRHDALKPGNIILSADGGTLIDLSVVLPVHDDWKLSAIAYSQHNPTFTSPEMATGNRDIDCRADIYSLGILLHYMLAGEPPFSGGDSSAILNRHLAAKRPDICELRTDVHANLGRLIQQMISPRADDRPKDWAEVRDALENRLAKSKTGETKGHRSVIAARPRRPHRRRQRNNTDLTKVWLGLIIGVTLVLLILLAWVITTRY
jgi:serine/threonine-protein kinase